jgi:two-component system, NtrC family, sensor kinase
MGMRFLAPLSAIPTVVPDVAPAASPAATRFYLTLRAKGVLALSALVVYGAFILLYLAHERGTLLHIVRQLEHVHVEHELLTKVNTGLTHAIVSMQASLNSGSIPSPHDDLLLDIASFSPGLPAVQVSYPETVQIVGQLQGHIAEIVKGRSLNTMIALRDSEQKLAAQLENLENGVEQRGERLSREYRELNQSITVSVSVMSLLGLAVFGVGGTLFFSGLTADIKKLEARAMAIVRGYRGKPVEVTRYDELGGLMQAVNLMQSELYQWERQQEIPRQRRFYQEKMAAVGSFAAAVAHEVSNPINSISGIAQYTIDAIRSHRRMDDETLCGNAELILEQTQRVSSIVRHIADLSAPRSPDSELLDINELVQSTCSFVRYDKRFRYIELVPRLDRDLPAVRAVADHLTQVLMNLLINAADAMEELVGRKPTIRVATRQADGEIILSVCDNGQGMDSAVLTQAFEQSFTTKPAGKGRGIGLYLCKSLIEEIGGRIELESTPGVGTTAQVRLPSQHGHAAVA